MFFFYFLMIFFSDNVCIIFHNFFLQLSKKVFCVLFLCVFVFSTVKWKYKEQNGDFFQSSMGHRLLPILTIFLECHNFCRSEEILSLFSIFCKCFPFFKFFQMFLIFFNFITFFNLFQIFSIFFKLSQIFCNFSKCFQFFPNFFKFLKLFQHYGRF